jgi:hypothetical protein
VVVGALLLWKPLEGGFSLTPVSHRGGDLRQV